MNIHNINTLPNTNVNTNPVLRRVGRGKRGGGDGSTQVWIGGIPLRLINLDPGVNGKKSALPLPCQEYDF